MGLRRTCPSPNQSSCQVSCQDPSSSNQCIVLQTMLVDGSPCGQSLDNCAMWMEIHHMLLAFRIGWFLPVRDLQVW